MCIRDRYLAAPDVSVAVAGRRLRHRRLLRHPPRLRDGRGLPRVRRRGAPAADPGDRRPRHEPHLVRPPVVPGGPQLARLAEARLVRLVGHRRRLPRRRVIFVDTEPSNWTWDPLAGQYYWHRFFSHQPDLNYENPEVQDEMLRVLRFWLDLGIDGFRLDAVPYLYEDEGTNCENLPPTHEYLKRVREEVDASYPDRVLLAEANQWPEDVVEYFGEGDECHMAFQFPIMPRMFMSLRREDATPILE